MTMPHGVRARVIPIVIVYVLALALWAGGLVVLGAVVAPTVFKIVPAPTSADAMTVVFRRFDVIAMACALVSALAEAALARMGGKPSRLDGLRAAAVVIASALAIVEGTYLAPAIEALHRGGALRGHGLEGLELERLHRIAEGAAKAELVCLTVAVVLLVTRAARLSEPSGPR